MPTEQSLHGVATSIIAFKPKGAVLFAPIEKINLFLVKFHMLCHVAMELYQFGNLSVLDASAFEHFNYTNKQFVRMTSMRKATTIEETVVIINRPQRVENEGVASKEQARNYGPFKQEDNLKVGNWKEVPGSLLVLLSRDEKRAIENSFLLFLKESAVNHGNILS